MNWTINAIKTFATPDGGGLNCNILRDGKKVGTAHDGGYGGMMEFYFPQQADAQAFDAFVKQWYASSGAAKQDEQEVRAMLGDKEFASAYPNGYEASSLVSDAQWVNHMVDEIKNKQRLDRHAKTKTLFQLEGDDPQAWRTLGKPYSAAAQAYLDAKYGAKVAHIYGVR